MAPPHWPSRTVNPRPGRCTRTVPQASGTRGVWGRSRWIGCGPPISKLWCSSARTAGCRFIGALGVHGVAAGIGRGGPRRAGGKKCGGCREAAGCGAQGGQTRRQRGRDRAAERCRRVAMLRTRRKQQAAERLHAGDQWTDCGLVFATEFGTPVEPRNLLRPPATSTAIRPTMLHARRSTE